MATKGSKKRARGEKPIPDNDPKKYGLKLSKDEKSQWAKLFPLKMVPTKYACQETLQKLGLDEDVWHLVKSVGWTKLMSGFWDTYRIPTLEFLSTLKINDEEKNIQFRNENKEFTLTFGALRELFGISEDSITEPPENYVAQHFWSAISNYAEIRFNPQRSKCSQIRNPVLRYIQKMIAHSFFARKETGNMKTEELFFLNAMLRKIPVDAVHFMLKNLRRISNLEKGTIGIGGMITAILLEVGVSFEDMSPISNDKFIDFTNLVNMKILFSRQPPWILTHAAGDCFYLPNTHLTTIPDTNHAQNCEMDTPEHLAIGVRALEELKKRQKKQQAKAGQEQQEVLRLEDVQQDAVGDEEGEQANEAATRGEHSQARARTPGKVYCWAQFNEWKEKDDEWKENYRKDREKDAEWRESDREWKKKIDDRDEKNEEWKRQMLEATQGLQLGAGGSESQPPPPHPPQ